MTNFERRSLLVLSYFWNKKATTNLWGTFHKGIYQMQKQTAHQLDLTLTKDTILGVYPFWPFYLGNHKSYVLQRRQEISYGILWKQNIPKSDLK